MLALCFTSSSTGLFVSRTVALTKILLSISLRDSGSHFRDWALRWELRWHGGWSHRSTGNSLFRLKGSLNRMKTWRRFKGQTVWTNTWYGVSLCSQLLRHQCSSHCYFQRKKVEETAYSMACTRFATGPSWCSISSPFLRFSMHSESSNC